MALHDTPDMYLHSLSSYDRYRYSLTNLDAAFLSSLPDLAAAGSLPRGCQIVPIAGSWK